MKAINLLAIILIISIGCTTTVSNDASTVPNGGKILNGPNAGATYTFASDEVGQLAINFSDAFNEERKIVYEEVSDRFNIFEFE